MPVRVLRVGFVGELGYEIHCPASYGAALWDLLLDAGTSLGIRPFGVEAQRVLRLEKGHIIVGQDTDGLTFPHEAEMAWAVADEQAVLRRPAGDRGPGGAAADPQAGRLHPAARCARCRRNAAW